MEQIVGVNKAIQLAKKCRENNQELVLVGGCFDILHYGHVVFLEKSRKKGDVLMVLLESDGKVRRLKGPERPLNTQEHRAKMLISLRMVDVVVKLPDMKNNGDYDDIISKLRPRVIAITENDGFKDIKFRQAKKVGARLSVVTKLIPNKSTTWLQDRIKRE